MGKWMAVLVVMAGCGVGTTARDDGPYLIGTPELRTRRLPTATTTAPIPKAPRETVRAVLDLQAPQGHEGQRLSVLVGLVGCGISVDAVGSAKIEGGRAHVRLNRAVPADQIRQVILTLDDGDGVCTENDLMWSAELVTGQLDLDVTLDLEALEVGPSWMCWGATED